jgi:hypothetical protein
MMTSGAFFDTLDASTCPFWPGLTFDNAFAMNADWDSGEVQGVERYLWRRIISMYTSERLHCLKIITKSDNLRSLKWT